MSRYVSLGMRFRWAKCHSGGLGLQLSLRPQRRHPKLQYRLNGRFKRNRLKGKRRPSSRSSHHRLRRLKNPSLRNKQRRNGKKVISSRLLQRPNLSRRRRARRRLLLGLNRFVSWSAWYYHANMNRRSLVVLRMVSLDLFYARWLMDQ